MQWHLNSWTKMYLSLMVSTFACHSITLQNSHSRFDCVRYNVARDHPDGKRHGSKKSCTAISLFFTYSLAFLADIPLTDWHLDNATGPSWDNDPFFSLCLHSCSKPLCLSLTSQTQSGVEKCVGVIEHCRITDPHLGLPTGAHAPADPSSTYDCNIYMRFIYDQGHCNISCYTIY